MHKTYPTSKSIHEKSARSRRSTFKMRAKRQREGKPFSFSFFAKDLCSLRVIASIFHRFLCMCVCVLAGVCRYLTTRLNLPNTLQSFLVRPHCPICFVFVPFFVLFLFQNEIVTFWSHGRQETSSGHEPRLNLYICNKVNSVLLSAFHTSYSSSLLYVWSSLLFYSLRQPTAGRQLSGRAQNSIFSESVPTSAYCDVYMAGTWWRLQWCR